MRRFILTIVFSFFALSCAVNREQFISERLRVFPKTTTQPFIVVSIRDNNLTQKIPDEIPATIIPSKVVYNIRVRVVVEFNRYTTKILKDQPFAYSFHTPESIDNQLKYANEVYEKVGLKFHAVECEFVEAQDDYRTNWIDASLHPDVVSVYFMSPNNFPYGGMSVFPWEFFPDGILMSFHGSESTLAHELGHYFGLMHTFGLEGDECEDTLPQIDTCDNEEPCKRVNCGNIMNYCPHSPKELTQCQQLRVIRYLRAARMKVVMPGPPAWKNRQYLDEKFMHFTGFR